MFLDRIIKAKQKKIEESKLKKPLKSIIGELNLRKDKRENNFIKRINLKNDDYSVIAELKKASPSKGIISEDFDFIKILNCYERGGASAVSVLTEEDFFLGSLKIFNEVRNAANLPLLRKDFIFDEYQLYETALLNADALLLIAAILFDDDLCRFVDIAESLGIVPLVEVHDEKDLIKALNSKARVIGVNNRNLKTFNVSLETSERLALLIPEDRIMISESGIKTKNDILRLTKCGFKSFLIGETLMNDNDPEGRLKELVCKG